MEVEVGIIGAGLAGLCCARRLDELGVSYGVFEAADHVGGRVATDQVGGFLLDRGFQVLLDSYPEARQVLDLEALGARSFAPGALVRQGGSFYRVVDPWRAGLKGLATLRAPFVSLGDALRMNAFRRQALGPREPDERTAEELLRGQGFSPALIESFFRPFFGGVTLDPELSVSASYLMSLFGWFAKGSAVLPANGMQAIPEQIADGLVAGAVRLGTPVASIYPRALKLASGEVVGCNAVVVATDASNATTLLKRARTPEWLGTTTLYYAAERSPVGEPILVLNGEGQEDGPVNNLCVLSDAQPTYAPQGQALVSVSILGVPGEPDDEIDRAVREQLGDWYGAQVDDWQLLRLDRIERALPYVTEGRSEALQLRGVFVCGDHVATPSIQGTMVSGRVTADAVHAGLA